jgi:predicted Zn-dependent peptidase
MVLLARPIFGRGDPEEPTLELANEIFGGSFASRLNMNLREAKGYTYGAHSQPSLRSGTGALLTYAMVRADVTGESLKETVLEMKGLSTRPPTDEEIARARAGLVQSLPGQFARTGAVAQAASALYTYRLPLDHFATYPQRLMAVTPEQIRAAGERYFSPDQMQVLLVGDEAQVRPQVEPLDLGAVVTRR